MLDFKFAISLLSAAVALSSCRSLNRVTLDQRDSKRPLIEAPLDTESQPKKAEEKPHFVPVEVIKEDSTDSTLKESLVDGALYTQRAFDHLTKAGEEIFYRAKEFVKGQKAAAYQSYAQPLQCAVNVSHILNQAGYNFSGSATYAVPSLLQAIEDKGGKIYRMPKFDPAKNNKAELIDFINKEFGGKIPTGAVVAGCESEDCNGEGASAHVSILGDKNANNDLLLYHNNWFRPNNYKGARAPYMVSLENFYDLERPREWMPTPWLNLKRNADGKVIDFVSKTPGIDDLDPLNGKYVIKIALTAEILKDIEDKNFYKHHNLVIGSNPNNNFFARESKREVCRANYPFSQVDARMSPNGQRQDKVYAELALYKKYGSTFRDYNFEFVILEKKSGWIKIKTYDANTFWGESKDPNYNLGEIWLRSNDLPGVRLYECFEKGTNY